MRILVLGYNPPPLQAGTKLVAANYRTWQFIQPLLDDGHEICLCVAAGSPCPDPALLPRGLQWQAVGVDRIGWIHQLQALHDRFAPDSIVALAFYPALWATRIKTSKPIWVDFYGDSLTIVQVARFRTGTDQGIGTHIALMRHSLLRGDVFSVCGTPQAHMLVGELAMCGRLNSRTLGYEFARVIGPGAPPVPDGADRRPETRGSLDIPPDAFVVLWCGGYNTWTDVDTLFSGLVTAMAGNPRVHFLSVGASTYQAAETVYDRLTRQVTECPYTSRFHFLGWRSWQEIPDLYRASDVGINIDGVHYETTYGTRTRLVEMLAYGLPVITSSGCELSDQIPVKGAGISFSSGDPASFARAILDLASSQAIVAGMRKAAHDLVRGEWSFGATTSELRSWANAPQVAPDHMQEGAVSRAMQLKYWLRTQTRLQLWRLGLTGQRRN